MFFLLVAQSHRLQAAAPEAGKTFLLN